MAKDTNRSADLQISRTAIEVTARVGLTFLLAYWCFNIAQPFLVAVVWGVILAVASHPAHRRLERLLGGRPMLAATLLAVSALLVLIGPLTLLARALVDNVSVIALELADGTMLLPTLPAWLADLPVVGGPLAQFWTLAATNLAKALAEIGPQLQAVGIWLLGLVAGAGFGLLNFLVAVVIAAILLAHEEGGRRTTTTVAHRLAGDRGPHLVALADRTIRNVARGVIGTALIQSLLVGIGLVVADVPAAAFLTLIAFLLCVVQIGPALVLLGAIVYIFTYDGALAGFLFLAWSILVGTCDNVIRPYLMSRGGDVPLPVILIGTIGGLLAHGLIGLFVGPVVFALGYQLFHAWAVGDNVPAHDELEAVPASPPRPAIIG